MSRVLFLLILLSCSTQSFAAASYEAQWQKANTFYKQKQYDSAAYYFEQIAAQQPADAQVYYNLGNAYYRLNKVGAAVLNYERALHIDPSFPEAEDNLALTQSRISNRIQPIPEIFFVKWWKAATATDKAAIWAMLSLLVFLAIIGVLVAKRFGKVSNVSSRVLGIVAFVWVILLTLSIASAYNRFDSNRAVVMMNDAPFYTGSVQSKNSILLPEGTTVKLRERNGDKIEVELPDGRTGWMELSLLEKI